MEDLAPPLQLVLTVKSVIENGESVRIGIRKFISQSDSDWARFLARWLLMVESQQRTDKLASEQSSPYRRALLQILEKGLRGETIHPILCEFEKELIDVSKLEIEKHISMLPLKMLVPLLLFQFPAYLILIFGALLRSFFIFTIFFAGSTVWAQSMSAQRQSWKLDRIAKANTKEELHRINRWLSVWEKLSTTCEIELQTNQIPLTCLKQIDFEREIGFLNKKVMMVRQEELNGGCVEKFGDICKKAAATKDMREIYRGLN